MRSYGLPPGYDAWRTASPYNDDTDVFVEAEKFLKEHEKSPESKDIQWAATIIRYLLDTLEEEGIT